MKGRKEEIMKRKLRRKGRSEERQGEVIGRKEEERLEKKTGWEAKGRKKLK